MNDWIGILWLVVLLAVNAFFVGSEFAVISARRSQIEPLAEKGSRRAKTALWAMEHATLMLAACQLGITVCSLIILNVSEPAIHHLLEGPLGITGWSEEVIGSVAFVIALLVVSYLHVVLGEMVPKNLSFSARRTAPLLLLAPPLVFDRPHRSDVVIGSAQLADRQWRSSRRSARRAEERRRRARSRSRRWQTIVAQSQREGVLLDTHRNPASAAFEFTDQDGCSTSPMTTRQARDALNESRPPRRRSSAPSRRTASPATCVVDDRGRADRATSISKT